MINKNNLIVFAISLALVFFASLLGPTVSTTPQDNDQEILRATIAETSDLAPNVQSLTVVTSTNEETLVIENDETLNATPRTF